MSAMKNRKIISDSKDCEKIKTCGGGCTASDYLINYLKNDERNIYVKEPNCPRDYSGKFVPNYRRSKVQKSLVHIDYLCTWIGKPV